jgi:hypothetical protein
MNRHAFTDCIKISTSYVIDENQNKTAYIFKIVRIFINKIIRLDMKIINMKMAIGVGLLLLIADIVIAVFAK